MDERFVGIQISPVSFVDEGVDNVLDTLAERAGVNVLLIGTISWLNLKVGRRISWRLDGWPDHGAQRRRRRSKGGSYIADHRPNFISSTALGDPPDAEDPELKDIDILDAVIPAARETRHEDLSGSHGAAVQLHRPRLVPQERSIFPNLPPIARKWTSLTALQSSIRSSTIPIIGGGGMSIIEDYCRSYDIDGVMWCNERRSPLDNLISRTRAPICFCEHCRREASERGIDV